jgi:hypothetical protein
VVLARGGGCVRACESVEAGWRLTGRCGCLGGGLLGFYVSGWGRFEGDWVDGKQHGRGIYTDPDGNRFEGDFIANKRTGRGTRTYANKDR